MRRARALLTTGFILAALGAGTLITGAVVRAPIVVGLILMAGVVFIVAGARGLRRAEPVQTRGGDPRRSRRRAGIALGLLGAFGLVALMVAATVAGGEAQGHAIGHLLTGVVALGLFAALAFPWQPEPGTTAAFSRSAVLILLGIAAFGSFLESLGGSGYDAANSARRIEGLAVLHDVALPIAAVGVPGILLGAVAGLIILGTRTLRRVRRPRPA
jgi:hypothetical protein